MTKFGLNERNRAERISRLYGEMRAGKRKELTRRARIRFAIQKNFGNKKKTERNVV
jgi:hypothetical protein